MKFFNRVKRNWKAIQIPLRVLELLFVIFGIPIALYNSFIAREELQNSQYQTIHFVNKDSIDYSLNFSNQLDNIQNTQIIDALESAQPILIENGGTTSDADLIKFLNLFNSINDAYNNDLLTSADLYNNFSYTINFAWKSKEIQEYLKTIRRNDSELLLGFDQLAETINQMIVDDDSGYKDEPE